MKAVVLTFEQWELLRDRLSKDHPLSVIAIREKMKRVLGFTVRPHKEWVPKMDGGYYNESIRLDFDKDSVQTMFMLKYSEYIQKKSS